MNTDEPVMGFESVTQALGWLPAVVAVGIFVGILAFAVFKVWPVLVVAIYQILTAH